MENLKDIAKEKGYNNLWDEAILFALENGHISFAQTQRILNAQYARAGIFIDKTIEYGYFDDMHKAKISIEDYKKIMQSR